MVNNKTKIRKVILKNNKKEYDKIIKELTDDVKNIKNNNITSFNALKKYFLFDFIIGTIMIVYIILLAITAITQEYAFIILALVILLGYPVFYVLKIIKAIQIYLSD